MTAKLTLATIAAVLVLISAVLPALAGGFALVASNGKVNALVIATWVCVVALWWMVLSIILRILEQSIWGARVHAQLAAAGAVGGFVVGFLARHVLFVTGPDSDYPASAYVLLYGLTYLGAVLATTVPGRIGTHGNGRTA